MLGELTKPWNPPTKQEPLLSDQKIKRGDNARALLNNELWKEAIRQVEYNALVKWRGTAPEEVERRETAWLYLNALDEVNKHIHTFLTDSIVEAEKLKREAEAKKRNGRIYE
ncbi:hypothetical protein EBZ38_03855 [bacterium]|nr:hypothetical protein [bacterium]